MNSWKLMNKKWTIVKTGRVARAVPRKHKSRARFKYEMKQVRDSKRDSNE